MELFQVVCTTCRARLSIRSADLIGQIHACPKCGGMVEIAPPPDWQPPGASPSAASRPSGGEPPAASSIQTPVASFAAAGHDGGADEASHSAGVAVAPAEARLVRRVRLTAMLIVGGAAAGLAAWAWFSSAPVPSPPPASHAAERSVAPSGNTAQPAPSAAEITAPSGLAAPPAANPATTDAPPPPAVASAPGASPAASVSTPAAPSAATAAPLPAPAADEVLAGSLDSGEAAGLGAARAASMPPPALNAPPAVASPMGTAALSAAGAEPAPPALVQAVFVPAVDVAARLADRLPAVHWPQVTLAGLLEALHDLSTLEFTLDADACLARGVAPGRTLIVAAEASTVGELLEKVLAPLGLEWREVNRHLLITVREDAGAEPVSASYTLEPRAAENPDAALWLIAAVPRLVEPDAWPADPREWLSLEGSALRARQRPDVHRRIAEFLALVSAVRRGQADASSRAALERRRLRAAPLLAAPVQANFHEPTSLRKLARHLQRQTGGIVLVDGIALAAEGLSPDVPCRLTAQHEPLAEALAKITAQLHLAWRAIDARTIEITSPRAAAARQELVWHPLEPQPAPGNAAAAALRLEQVLADAMPADPRTGPWRPTVVIDPAAGGAWVLAPQAAIEGLAATASEEK